jgi:hypothetical protein
MRNGIHRRKRKIRTNDLTQKAQRMLSLFFVFAAKAHFLKSVFLVPCQFYLVDHL